MADISKCSNTKCPAREECYRYRVIPSQFRQSYSDYDREKQNCFVPIGLFDESRLIPKGENVRNLFENYNPQETV